jgi:hypothetical protein
MIVRSFQLLCLGMILSILFCSSSLAGQSEKIAAMSDNKLLSELVKLDIGLEQYRIGKTLTKEQLKIADKNSIKKKYQGTIKFKDGDVGVVADAASKNIIALYLENKDAGKEDTKNMIATLMMMFGQPTTMAHEKIVYWAFNKDGLIAEDVHRKAKDVNELNILATVKFNSKTRFMEDGAPSKDEEKEEETKEEKNSIYCIVSSPALLERFAKK